MPDRPIDTERAPRPIHPTDRRPAAAERRSIQVVFGVGLAAWIATAAISWAAAAPLGHDEAQYALAATDLLAGEPPRWNYLSQGMNAIALPGVIAGGSERALRLVPAVVGILFVLAAAELARRVAGASTAAWVVAVLAATISMAARSADLLSDLPSATCLLAGTAVVVTELTRDGGPRWRLVAAAPWFAAAFYLRYGSCIPIAAIGGVAVIAGWRAIARRPGPAIAAVATFAVLVVPHLVRAVAITGSPLGIILESSSALQGAASGVALATYLTTNPFHYYGAVTAPVVVVGVIAGVRAIARRDRAPSSPARATTVMVWAIAVGGFIGVGLTPIAQARYVYFPVVVFVILGVDLVARWIAAQPDRRRAVLGRAAAVAVAIAWIVVARSVSRQDDRRLAALDGTWTAVAAIRSDLVGPRTGRGDAAGARCYVVCQHTTQTEWYSGCRAVHAPPLDAIGRAPVYAVHDNVGEHQPDLDAMPGRHVTVLDRPGVVKVIRLEPDPPPSRAR